VGTTGGAGGRYGEGKNWQACEKWEGEFLQSKESLFARKRDAERGGGAVSEVGGGGKGAFRKAAKSQQEGYSKRKSRPFVRRGGDVGNQSLSRVGTNLGRPGPVKGSPSETITEPERQPLKTPTQPASRLSRHFRRKDKTSLRQGMRKQAKVGKFKHTNLIQNASREKS